MGAAGMGPEKEGHQEQVLVGYGTRAARKRDRFDLAAARPKLAPGTYHIECGIDDDQIEQETLGWLLES